MTEQEKKQKFALTLNKYIPELSKALPKHIDVKRFERIILTEYSQNPELTECTPISLFSAIIKCAQLGIEPGNSLGHAYFLPFKKGNTKEVQFIVGYRGMIELARRSGQIISISAHCFYENDIFEYELGLSEKLRHIPAEGDRGALRGVHAVAHLVGGGHQMEVLYKHDIEKARAASRGGDSKYSPWTNYYEEMARKTAIRKLFKYLPVSSEIMSLLNTPEYGEQNNNRIFDGEYEKPTTEKTESKSQALIQKIQKTEKNDDHQKENDDKSYDYAKVKAGIE